jgi:integrase
MSRGTLILDRMCGPLGRLRLATGAHDKREAATFNGLITDLIKMCDWATLERLRPRPGARRAELTIRQVYYARVRGEALPAAVDTTPAWPLMKRWLATLDTAASTKETYAGLIDRLTQAAPTAAIGQLAAVLEQAKAAHQARGHRSTFNDRRQLCLQFLRDHFGPRHALVYAVQDIKPLKVARRPGNPQTPDQIRALVAAIPSQATNIWGMCLTGMRVEEWFDLPWAVDGDRIVIPGTKTDNAVRIVPKTYPIARPFGTYSRLVQILHRRTGGDVQPHDLRRTFMCWMEDSGIPRSRRQTYLGHAVQGVTELYERRRSVEPWLAEDAAKLRGYLGDNPMAIGLQVLA